MRKKAIQKHSTMYLRCCAELSLDIADKLMNTFIRLEIKENTTEIAKLTSRSLKCSRDEMKANNKALEIQHICRVEEGKHLSCSIAIFFSRIHAFIPATAGRAQTPLTEHFLQTNTLTSKMVATYRLCFKS